MTTPTDTYKPGYAVHNALQKFRETERARLLLDRKEKELRQALETVDISDDSPELAYYYAESQKIIDEFDDKRTQRGLD